MAKQEEGLNEAQRKFCKEYIFDWNGTRAYQAAYPNSKPEAARSSASDLLTNPNIQAYIKEIQQDLEKQAGISRLSLALELKKIAYSSIAHLHNTWIERKEFEQLTEEQKACISEIQTKVIPTEYGTIEEVKIKLYDKQRAIDSLKKMFGYDLPDKVEHLGGLSITWNEEKTY